MSGRTGQKRAAQVVRNQLAAERRRRRSMWTSVVVVAVLVVAGLASWVAIANQRPTSSGPPPSAVDAGTGFAAGTGPVTIDVYEDFMCPLCRQVEERSGRTLEELVSQNKVKVVYHPIAILDRYSSTRYSTRAAAASACAAEGGKFTAFHGALFAQQPPEGGAGLSDDKLIEIGRSVGLTDGGFAGCVRDGTYHGWAAQVTDVASGRGITGTPTVLVAGKPVQQPTPEAITAAVAAAGA